MCAPAAGYNGRPHRVFPTIDSVALFGFPHGLIILDALELVREAALIQRLAEKTGETEFTGSLDFVAMHRAGDNRHTVTKFAL